VLAVGAHPVRDPLQGGALEPRRPQLTAAPAGDQAGPLEHLQVLGDGLRTDRKRLGELVDRGLAAGQPREDRPPGRVGERVERGAQLIIYLVYQPTG
jgi:hypothetical protein